MKGFPRNATALADRPVVLCETESLSHAELDARSSRLALALAAFGLDEGGRLGILLPNCIELIECLAATAKLGATSTTLNWNLPPEELRWLVDDADLAALVADPELAPDLDPASTRPDLPVIWSGDDYESRLEAAGDGPVAYRWPTPCPVSYTVGAAGRPVALGPLPSTDPVAMEADHDHRAARWGYRPDDVHLVAGPLYHPAPAGFCELSLYVGATVVLMESWEPGEFLRQVQAHRATTTFLTPAHLIRLLELPERHRRSLDASSLRHVVHAGTPCPRVVKEEFMEAFPRAELWELYGVGGAAVAWASPEEWRRRPGTVGRPWPGVEIEVRRPGSDEPLPPGEDGVVWVRPTPTWTGEAATAGDIGHLDADGYLYLTDRLVDLVGRGGARVAPREVEEVLHRHPGVVDCAVVGAPLDEGEGLLAVVETRGEVSESDLSEFCAVHLSASDVPTAIALCDAVPRDLDGTLLRGQLLGGRPGPGAGGP